MESLIPFMPLLAVLVPAAGALLIACTGERRANLREFWSVAAGVVMSALIASMIPEVLAGGTPECGFQVLPATSEFHTGFRLGFRVDAFGLLFALGASLLWILTSFYSIGYMRSLKEHAQTRYFACFALALSATVGVAFSANLFTMFLFYEALTLVTYPLVGHHETPEAKAGARKYVIYLLGAAKVLLMAAIILTYNVVGTLEFRPAGSRRRWTAGIHRADHGAALASAGDLRAVPVWICEKRADAAAQLAAGGDGGPDAGERTVARGGRGQDGRILHAAGVSVRFRPGGHARDRGGPTGAGRGLGDDRGRVAAGAGTGQPQGPAGVLHGEPALLHHPGRGAVESRRSDGRHRPYHEPRRIEDHAVPLRGSIYVSAHKTKSARCPAWPGGCRGRWPRLRLPR